MGPIVSVDGDVLRYRIGFASQESRYLAICPNTGDVLGAYPNKTELKKEHDETLVKVRKQNKKAPVANCLHSCKLQMEHIIEKTGASKAVVYLSGKGNFREKVSTFLPYKGNRLTPRGRAKFIRAGKFPYYFQTYKSAGQGRPLHYDALTEYLVKHWDAQIVDGIEADDILTIEQTKYDYSSENKTHVIASIDKDLYQVPGWFYNFVKDEWTYVTPEEAELNLWAQAMSGDMTDCIFGVKGIGLKGAKKILSKVKPDLYSTCVRNAYVDMFEKLSSYLEELNPLEKHLIENYTAPQYFNEVFQLVYLLRDEEELSAKTQKDIPS